MPYPIALRQVHPSIAPPVTGAHLNGTGPLFQYPDGKWNHGEGFSTTVADADQGGWFGEDGGMGVTLQDVHVTTGWANWTWTDPYHPNGTGTPIRRFVGHLRPAGYDLPGTVMGNGPPAAHPQYGITSGLPFGDERYVDQGAFEVFAPTTQPGPTQPIAVLICAFSTIGFPGPSDWNRLYPGFHSPDGLMRGPSPSGFRTNLAAESVIRPGGCLEGLAAYGTTANYWPIVAYPVPSASHRPTTLNEQRYMQLLHAVQLMLEDSPSSGLNPLSTALPPSGTNSFAQRAVVVFAGGSNGLLQSCWAAMRYPDRVHGVSGEEFNPNIHRVLQEQAFGWMLGRLLGDRQLGGELSERDFLYWGRYAWNQGLWLHDLSYLLRFANNTSYRPAWFTVGDDDIATTGTDFVAVASGAGWSPYGIRRDTGVGTSWPIERSVAWSIGDTGCHGDAQRLQDPYSGGAITYFRSDITHGLIQEAVARRMDELALSPPPTIPPYVPQPRGSQFYAVDEPHEWALGRPGVPIATSNSTLQVDHDWFEAVQPGAAGTWLGHKEAMLIKDHKVYVVGAEGVVSAFTVGLPPTYTNHPLVRVAVSHDLTNGKPMSLGLDGRALAPLDTATGWKLLVGTRRHIHKLNSATLALEAQLELPWEVAMPHHIRVGDLLSGHPGNEIVFATEHGGLVFLDENLTLLQEWPEPGIVDFELGNGFATILSHRGVVANVSFAIDPGTGLITASLLAASRSLPHRLVEYKTTYQEALDSPSQGTPLDLELLEVANGASLTTSVIALWGGDEDGLAVRQYHRDTMVLKPLIQNILGDSAGLGKPDIETCREGVASPASDTIVGDHLLALTMDTIHLYDQAGNHLAEKVLFKTTDPVNPYTPFGRQAHKMVVGDLIDNAITGSVGQYPDEVVVATQSGALLWLHVNDIAAPGTALGSAYHLQVGPGPQTVIGKQPHTNANLSAAWAITQRPGEELLHVLDQRGGYWQIATGGNTNFWERKQGAVGARGWEELNRDPVTGVVQDLASPGWDPARLATVVSPDPGGAYPKIISSWPWCPIEPFPLEFQETGRWKPMNWVRKPVLTHSFDGFLVHAWGGSVIYNANQRECWQWSAPEIGESWGNMLEGIRFQHNANQWDLIGLWASTEHDGVAPNWAAPIKPKLEYLDVRSSIIYQPSMTQQSIRAHLVQGSPVLVIGCPGGRVRIVEPMQMATATTGHDYHGITAASNDLGHGGAALATKQLPDDTIEIWFGTMYGPTLRPANYVNDGSLAPGEVATGEIHKMSWTPGGGLVANPTKKRLEPDGNRGGYAVTGLAVADLLPEPPGHDELIVCTLAGDVIVMDADSLVEIWRAQVPGAVGAYNSIIVTDMDDDNRKELYVCGSFGIWRFIRT